MKVNRQKHIRKTPAKSRAVRPIPRSSKGHFVGELVYNRNGQPQRLGFSSLIEYHAALCLIYRPDFFDIEEQLAPLTFRRPGGEPSKHYFDFRFTQKGGKRTCISVKPERIAQTYEYRAMIASVELSAIGKICDNVLTITERNINPIQLHNSKLFHAARNPEPELDDAVLDEIRKIGEPISIEDFLERSGIAGRGFFSVVRAIRFGHARLFTTEKIVNKTLIERSLAA